MENASNALIMAGGVLIGILIISLAVYLFIDFGSTSAEINKQTEQQQLIQFNAKFTVYEDEKGEKGLTIYDIITVAGYAQENNNYYGDDDNDENFFNNYKIEVIIKSSRGTTYNVQKNAIDKYNEMIQDEQKNISELPQYTCNIKYHDNGRVKTIIFNQK